MPKNHTFTKHFIRRALNTAWLQLQAIEVAWDEETRLLNTVNLLNYNRKIHLKCKHVLVIIYILIHILVHIPIYSF